MKCTYVYEKVHRSREADFTHSRNCCTCCAQTNTISIYLYLALSIAIAAIRATHHGSLIAQKARKVPMLAVHSWNSGTARLAATREASCEASLAMQASVFKMDNAV